MTCYARSFVLFWRTKYSTPPYLSFIISTRCLYKISQEILILLHKWISPLSDKDSDYTSLGFIIITSLFAWAIWFAVKNTPLSGRPRVCLSPQFPVTISRKGLICLPFLKPVLLGRWHVRLLELTTEVAEQCIMLLLYIPHDMLSSSSRLIARSWICTSDFQSMNLATYFLSIPHIIATF